MVSEDLAFITVLAYLTNLAYLALALWNTITNKGLSIGSIGYPMVVFIY